MTVVEIATGKLRGERRPKGIAFKGIPYGASTAAEARFMPPKKRAPWAGTLDATRFGDRAPQVDRPFPQGFEWLFSTPPWSEDCLVMNVFTPATGDGKRPVMVWLHGGAFAFGSADVPVLDGEQLAASEDVVVVTLNHRLNAFGYFPPPEGDDRFADAGNAGMLDLVLALEWVRDNIATFGGDPNCVTIFGQSGGGAKVAVLMAMEKAKGLFHRAIVQSPSSGFRVQTREHAEPFGHALSKRLHRKNGDLEALQKVPAEQLLDATTQLLIATGGEDRFRPMIDHRTLSRHPFYPEAPATSADIPLLIGYAATEASFYLASDSANRSLTLEQARHRLKRFMKLDDGGASRLLSEYSANHPKALPIDLLMHAAGDHMYRLTTIEGAEQKAQQGGSPAFLYEFAFSSPAYEGFVRSPHTAEIPYVFGNIEMARAFTGSSESASMQMQEAMGVWARFARTGDPNGGKLPHWTPFNLESRATMLFDAPSTRLAFDPGGADRKVMARFPRFAPGSPLNFRGD